MIEGKVWGTTEPLIVNSSLEVHRITVIKGGYCSLHKHQSKYNAFYVMKGGAGMPGGRGGGGGNSHFSFSFG